MTIKEAKTILEITKPDTPLDELKKIFKKKMLNWHPDIAINRGVSEKEATQKSQEIIMAYELLSENLDSLEESTFKHNYQTYYNYKTSSTRSYKQYYDYNIDEIDAKFVDRITMKSSNVKWIDYISDLEILVVRFKNSQVYYLYYDVPISVFSKFKITDSPGKFVHKYLQGYRYDSHSKYAEWLNIYKSISEITDK